MITAARQINHHQDTKASPIEIFRERAEARAMLVANGLMTLHDAVDGMQEAAVSQGLVATHGQDEVQRILSEAFARWALR